MWAMLEALSSPRISVSRGSDHHLGGLRLVFPQQQPLIPCTTLLPAEISDEPEASKGPEAAASAIPAGGADDLVTDLGRVRMAWEGVRDFCYIIQASKMYDRLTTAIIVINSIILAIIWYECAWKPSGRVLLPVKCSQSACTTLHPSICQEIQSNRTCCSAPSRNTLYSDHQV